MPWQQKERRERSPHSLDILTDSDEGEIHAGAQEIGRAKGSTLKQQTSPTQRRTFLKLGGSGLAALASWRHSRPAIVFADAARAKRSVSDSQ